jgi:homoserine O-acetyltransferase/O-succinyltransferase
MTASSRSFPLVLPPVLCLLVATIAARQPPQPVDGDFVLRDFHFRSGEVLPELRLHYMTYGRPQKDASGRVLNAVMVIHGTGGSGQQFTGPNFAGVLFGSGQLLDAERYFIILPDSIGHGHSSKPSDGLHAKFPHYDYADMVEAQYRLLTDGLNVNHLRLLMGTSMGCMHSWLWTETYPDFMDAALPLACLPVQIAGRNRVTRKMILDSIRTDPEWLNGDYKEQPRGLRTAIYLLMIMGSSPLQMQKQYPSRDQADAFLDSSLQSRMASTDANDLLYQVDSSRNYDPSSQLENIKTHMLYINSADDFINPPELCIAEQQIRRVKRGRFVLLPISDQTRGHGTHTLPAIWAPYLTELMAESQP